MPRTHGRIMSAIWNDGDFIHMRRGAQGMFMFLLSQPDLSHAGLVPMRINRWAKKAEDLSSKQVRSELDYLDDRDFIVVDEDTEEVLIRTMVRNDGVYKQPLVMERMREDAKQIESPMLRWAFASELERLPLDELSTEPSKNDGPSVRERVERVVAQLRADFADATEPSREAIERVTDTPHAGAHTSTFPLPPSPSPQPPTKQDLSDSSDDEAAADRFEEFWETYGYKLKRAEASKAWAKAIRKADPEVIITAAAAYVLKIRADKARRGDRATDQAHASSWLNGERWEDDLGPINAPAVAPQSNAQAWLQLATETADAGWSNVSPFRQIGGAS